MKRQLQTTLAAILLISVCITKGYALDLTNRFGLGYSVGEVNTITGRYWISRTFAMDGLLGFILRKGENALNIGTQLWSKVAGDKNINLSVGGRFMIETTDISDDDVSFGPMGNIEYFFPGIDNLAFQAGIGIMFHTRGTQLNTAIAQAGLLYYF